MKVSDTLRAARERLLGRSYWHLRYTDRDDVYEWQVDWSLAPKQTAKEVLLHCPNGQVAVLGSTHACGDRLVQLKTAVVGAGIDRRTTGHLIGLIEAPDGRMTCWHWDYDEQKLVGPYATSFWEASAGHLGPLPGLSQDHLGVSV